MCHVAYNGTPAVVAPLSRNHGKTTTSFRVLIHAGSKHFFLNIFKKKRCFALIFLWEGIGLKRSCRDYFAGFPRGGAQRVETPECDLDDRERERDEDEKVKHAVLQLGMVRHWNKTRK